MKILALHTFIPIVLRKFAKVSRLFPKKFRGSSRKLRVNFRVNSRKLRVNLRKIRIISRKL